ncbi:sigma-70 family RNA polymerase sigma factor [Mucilaginibacter sp. UR6-1]|uniref:RNA polymerase sigma factor n=1 Tax=Mucilaginibacter sp. UR6-1 TaxID=1435643 RepID=UPI001E2BDF1B|nr:sigma-70 family RNA polymerase sigma factor [Mucilaginibacter sp. UR6-1]MCC8408035.1 sigma-70 family RNA polymerase sigma factor [Mucilaginibacter sp. UR6-1]
MRTGTHVYSETELLQLLKLGNTSAFDRIYDLYWKSLYLSALSRINDEDAAKDIVQNVFIDIWQKHNALEINSTLKQYLHGAVKMKVLHHYRTENIKQQVLDNALERITQLLHSNQNLSAYFDLERIVSEEVEGMPVNMKNSFLLRSDSYSVKEIASSLNLAEQTVSNNITEALKRLKKRIRVEYPERYIGCVSLIMMLFTKS